MTEKLRFCRWSLCSRPAEHEAIVDLVSIDVCATHLAHLARKVPSKYITRQATVIKIPILQRPESDAVCWQMGSEDTRRNVIREYEEKAEQAATESKLEEAAEMLEICLKHLEQLPKDQTTARIATKLGLILCIGLERCEEGIARLKTSWEIEKAIDPQSDETVKAANMLARLQLQCGEEIEARHLLRSILRSHRELDRAELVTTQSLYGWSCYFQENKEKAEYHLLRSLDTAERLFPDSDALTETYMYLAWFCGQFYCSPKETYRVNSHQYYYAEKAIVAVSSHPSEVALIALHSILICEFPKCRAVVGPFKYLLKLPRNYIADEISHVIQVLAHSKEDESPQKELMTEALEIGIRGAPLTRYFGAWHNFRSALLASTIDPAAVIQSYLHRYSYSTVIVAAYKLLHGFQDQTDDTREVCTEEFACFMSYLALPRFDAYRSEALLSVSRVFDPTARAEILTRVLSSETDPEILIDARKELIAVLSASRGHYEQIKRLMSETLLMPEATQLDAAILLQYESWVVAEMEDCRGGWETWQSAIQMFRGVHSGAEFTFTRVDAVKRKERDTLRAEIIEELRAKHPRSFFLLKAISLSPHHDQLEARLREMTSIYKSLGPHDFSLIRTLQSLFLCACDDYKISPRFSVLTMHFVLRELIETASHFCDPAWVDRWRQQLADIREKTTMAPCGFLHMEIIGLMPVHSQDNEYANDRLIKAITHRENKEEAKIALCRLVKFILTLSEEFYISHSTRDVFRLLEFSLADMEELRRNIVNFQVRNTHNFDICFGKHYADCLIKAKRFADAEPYRLLYLGDIQRAIYLRTSPDAVNDIYGLE